MAENENTLKADLGSNENLAPGTQGSSPEDDDVVTENEIDQLEAMTGGEDYDNLQPIPRDLRRQFNSLDASTEEELDALEVNLTQDNDIGERPDSSGRVFDEIGEEEMAKFTEVGPAVNGRGAESVEPGTQDTSETYAGIDRFRRGVNDSEAIVEGNIDEPLDEGL